VKNKPNESFLYENFFRKKDKKSEKEYVCFELIYILNCYALILVMVLVVKKMVKKKNQVEKIARKRKNNC